MENNIYKSVAENMLKATLLGEGDSFCLDMLEKGKRAQMGETRQWKGGTYRRTPNGWERVRDNKGGGSSEKPSPKEESSKKPDSVMDELEEEDRALKQKDRTGKQKKDSADMDNNVGEKPKKDSADMENRVSEKPSGQGKESSQKKDKPNADPKKFLEEVKKVNPSFTDSDKIKMWNDGDKWDVYYGNEKVGRMDKNLLAPEVAGMMGWWKDAPEKYQDKEPEDMKQERQNEFDDNDGYREEFYMDSGNRQIARKLADLITDRGNKFLNDGKVGALDKMLIEPIMRGGGAVAIKVYNRKGDKDILIDKLTANDLDRAGLYIDDFDPMVSEKWPEPFEDHMVRVQGGKIR